MSDRLKKRDTKINRKEKQQYKTFIGSRAEGQGFADRRKKKIQYEYLKLKKKENKAVYDGRPIKDRHGMHPEGRPSFKGQHAFTKTQTLFQRQKEEKMKEKKEIMIKKKEVDNALQKYNNSKKSKFLKLCKRTHKGQPVMKNQIEYLLEKIQKQTEHT
ncbi:thyroid transcription factor 1-associated protein 26 homolog isoform X2 [Gigantopelta aegis]|uniref:thyroid transcription factor 1-associated protein 26 homolog isoform X2 n=1 Tax=Gigantopelta aegis TaxID=1735272 RepID=UPI001B88A480|nr:thyroid transcription factor 1-associated protein 26 homolog isoform X2 [Gigantopelta aegis]